MEKNKKTSAAQHKAQLKYDRNSADKFKKYGIKLNADNDKDIIEKLNSVPSIQGYIKELIRKDIQDNLEKENE